MTLLNYARVNNRLPFYAFYSCLIRAPHYAREVNDQTAEYSWPMPIRSKNSPMANEDKSLKDDLLNAEQSISLHVLLPTYAEPRILCTILL